MDVDGVRVQADTTIALVAHGLLNSLGVISGSAATLDRMWERLPDDSRRQLCAAILHHADLVRGVLGDLARGLPTEVLEALGPTVE